MKLSRRKFIRTGALWLPTVCAISRPKASWYYAAASSSGNGLLNNLEAYWALDEESGTRYDSTANNHDLSDVNTVGYATGKISNAADFENSANEYLSINDNAGLSYTGNFSVSCWIQLESEPTLAFVLSKDDTTSGNREFSIFYDNSVDRIGFTVGRTGSATVDLLYANNFGAVTTGVWYHIVATFQPSADTMTLRINNGTADSKTDKTIDPQNGGSPFRIGYYGGSTNTYDWDGLIDEVGFWKAVLTADQITALYNSGSGLAYSSFTS